MKPSLTTFLTIVLTLTLAVSIALMVKPKPAIAAHGWFYWDMHDDADPENWGELYGPRKGALFFCGGYSYDEENNVVGTIVYIAKRGSTHNICR